MRVIQVASACLFAALAWVGPASAQFPPEPEPEPTSVLRWGPPVRRPHLEASLQGGLIPPVPKWADGIGWGKMWGFSFGFRPWAHLAFVFNYDRSIFDFDASSTSFSRTNEYVFATHVRAGLRYYPYKKGLFEPLLGVSVVQFNHTTTAPSQTCYQEPNGVAASLHFGLELWITPWLRGGLIGVQNIGGGSSSGCVNMFIENDPPGIPNTDHNFTLQMSLGTGVPLW